MKKLVAVLLLAVSCVGSWAVDLPVPEELVGSQTVGIVHVHLKALKVDQIVKTLTDKLGSAPDADGMGQFKDFLSKFKDAGGQGVTFVLNASKDSNPDNAMDNVVFLVTKGEDADNAKLTELFAEMTGPVKDKLAPGCPKEIGNTLAWYTAKYKKPKASEDRATAFSEAYAHLAKDSTVSVVVVPDEEAAELAEEKLKESKPAEAKLIKALLSATGICIFTDFGAAAEPALKILVLAADADGAVVLNKAATGLIDGVKKDAPPPLEALLKSLATVQAGANVQLSIDVGELAKAIKTFAAEAAPAQK